MRKMKIVNSNREKYEKFIDEFNDNDGLWADLFWYLKIWLKNIWSIWY